MKKLFILLIALIFTNSVLAEEYIYKTGIALDNIPQDLYGNWRVSAKLDDTNSYQTFKPASIDFWTLSRVGDKVTLSNPFSGANAEVSIKTIEGNLIVFSKKAPYDNKLLTDTITIRLTKDTFTGLNSLTLETFSNIDKQLIKSETARYIIKGEKISGQSILAN